MKSALEYYVYALVDPRDNKIFYIGKGVGDRVFQHCACAIDSDEHSLKLDTIRQILAEGLDVKHYIVRHKLTEEMAFIVESTLIDLLTYNDFNTERVLTNIAAGHHQWDEGIKTTEEIAAIYDCAKAKINPNETLLLVSLNKSYDQKKAKGVYVRPDIYECTRKYWPIAKSRLNEIDYVLGVYRGVVREVIKPTKWFAADVAEDGTVFKKTRYGCDGEELPDSHYMNKDVTDFPFGSGGAVRYINGFEVE